MLKYTILAFLNKLFFILKASANGWIVSYIGGNRYEFKQNLHSSNSYNVLSPDLFLQKFKHSVFSKEN
uniref:Uncharacterized protein n=1 Tax=viral metagenome TaxID=1070528 RepID=A0A6C0DZR6_9ZZZZ